MSFVSASEGYATNDNGGIAKFTNGTWSQLVRGGATPLHGHWARAGEVFAVGGIAGVSTSGRIVRVVGSTVTDITPTGGMKTLNAAFGNASNDVWFVGEAGTVAHWDGTTVTVSPPLVSANLQAVWGTSANHVLAVGNSGTIIRFNGVGWSVVAQPSGNSDGYFAAIHGISANEFAIAGAKAWRWNSGAWTEMAVVPSTNNLGVLSMTYRAANDVWVATAVNGNPTLNSPSEGRVLFWDGLGWAVVNSGVPRHWALAFQDPNTIWVTSDSGAWWRRTNFTIETLSPPQSLTSRTVALAGTPPSLLALGDNGLVRTRSGNRWSTEADAGTGIQWTAGCGIAGGVAIGGTSAGRFYAFAPGATAPTTFSTTLPSIIQDLVCFDQTAVASTFAQVAFSTGGAPWRLASLPPGFSVSWLYPHPLNVVPGADRVWVGGSANSYAQAVLLSDAGTQLSLVSFGAADAQLGWAGGEIGSVFPGTQNNELVFGAYTRVSGVNATYVVRTPLPRAGNPQQLWASSILFDDADRATDDIIIQTSDSTVFELPLDGGFRTQALSLGDRNWNTRCFGSQCFVFGPRGQVLRRE